MFSESVIDPRTIQAYQETHFHVRGAKSTTLLIGRPNTNLLTLQKSARVNCSAFITACNPHSQARDAATNLHCQELLAKELRARSLNFIEGFGQHPSGDWSGGREFFGIRSVAGSSSYSRLASSTKCRGLVRSGRPT